MSIKKKIIYLFITLLNICILANPQNPQVVNGSVSLKEKSNTLQIKASDKSIINWEAFSIKQGETTRFIQPDAKACVLNRVIGNEKSIIDGLLKADGHIFLINPQGILITENGKIDTAAFLSSLKNISDKDFLKYKELFFHGESNASLINLGTITAWDGDVTLIADMMETKGSIQAKDGNLHVIQGDVFIQFQNNHLLFVRPDTKNIDSLKEDLGKNGHPYQMGMNVSGTIDALGIKEENGKIFLVAEDAAITVSSKMSADNQIALTSPDITVTKDAQIQTGTNDNESGSISIKMQKGQITNEGTIIAHKGHINLTSNKTDGVKPGIFFHQGSLDASGAQGGNITIEAEKCLLSGTLTANGYQGNGGEISINAEKALIEMRSAIKQAQGTYAGKGGKISFFSPKGNVFSSGTFDVTSKKATGGDIYITARHIALASAHINASGNNGGNIFIGGGLQGQDPNILNASTTNIIHSTSIKANGQKNGDGGQIVIWSDDHTTALGKIEAKGGGVSGNGGFVEISSKNVLNCTSRPDVSAQNGQGGKILLDPKNITIDATSGIFPQYELINPDITDGATFGEFIYLLTNGNVVVVNSTNNFAATQGGAVYLYNGSSGALISAVHGNNDNDTIGSDGATILNNGNFVIISPLWNGVASDGGAVTWVDGDAGLSGYISTSNSLYGSTASDQIGGDDVIALSNGNYVVASSYWDNGATADVGAITWGDGTSGTTGAVSTSNSLYGPTASDRIGSHVVVALSNGNYVAASPYWDNGGTADVGAVTWGNGTTGITGAVSTSNSLYGSTLNDHVGSYGITPLINGNYIAVSPLWDNGATADVGAVTLGNGTTGTTGAVSTANSLYGNFVNDQIGKDGIYELYSAGSFDNYIVFSSNWNSNAGAVTWCDGSTPTTGAVTTANSLCGSTSNDHVGSDKATLLTNGNYVVISPDWYNGAIVQAGAVTWGSGASGVSGLVSTANSLCGSTTNDHVGEDGVVALTNGNYVVISSHWDISVSTDNVGAVTWGDGTNGTTGAVSTGNSLCGVAATDRVGSGGVVALSNGNYVVASPLWNNGIAADAGAVTWGDGTSGTTGQVTTSNSLYGSTASDQVGSGGVTALTSNGNYVVNSPLWNGVVTEGGAVTWGDGTSGTTGPVSTSNSLYGSTASDHIGTFITALTNGNYVVNAPEWDNGAIADAGAVTWGNGTSGTTGAVSTSNSLYGSTANDYIGYGAPPLYGSVALSNGNYVAGSYVWNNGALTLTGAGALGNGTYGTTGEISTANSITGQTASTSWNQTYENTVTNSFIMRFESEDEGKIRVGPTDPTLLPYDFGSSKDMTIPPSFLTEQLNRGIDVEIQANNNVIINSDITVNNPTGDGGNLTIRSGKIISIAGDITTDNGDLTLIGNDDAADGVVSADRDIGYGFIRLQTGQSIDTGTGALSIQLLDATGISNALTGDIILDTNSSIATTTGGVNIHATDENVVFYENSSLNTSSGDILVIADKDIIGMSNNPGSITIQSTSGDVTMVVDNENPSSPDYGANFFSMPTAAISSTSGAVRLFTSIRQINNMPTTINGATYTAGTLGTNSATEQWEVYYPSATGGSPFTIFYKTTLGESSSTQRSTYKFERAISEPFQLWRDELLQQSIADIFYAWDKKYTFIHPIYPLWPLKRQLYPISWQKYFEQGAE